MIEIPEPPTVAACGGCANVLTWLWSHRRTCWVAFIPVTADVYRVHRCAGVQEPRTWRAVTARAPGPGQVETNAAGRRKVEEAISKDSAEEEESGR